MSMTRQEATAKLGQLVKDIYALVHQAEQLSDESGVGFSLDIAYGMGGWYTPKKKEDETNEDEDDWYASDEGGWQASSQSC